MKLDSVRIPDLNGQTRNGQNITDEIVCIYCMYTRTKSGITIYEGGIFGGVFRIECQVVLACMILD